MSGSHELGTAGAGRRDAPSATLGSLSPRRHDVPCRLCQAWPPRPSPHLSYPPAPLHAPATGKPFNPILGETFQGAYPNGTQVYIEQIAHHPPISSWQVYDHDARVRAVVWA